MKVAVLSESPSDEAAVRILVKGIHGRDIEDVDIGRYQTRTRGWTSIPPILPTVIRALHYHREADALVVVIDSNDSPIHTEAHEEAQVIDPKCRVCHIQEVAIRTQVGLAEIPGRGSLRVSFGLAVPAIEAWLRCGEHHEANEAAWVMAREQGEFAYDRMSLKRDLYGTDRPSLEMAIGCAKRHATRLADNIGLLEQEFPAGFGLLARDVRSW